MKIIEFPEFKGMEKIGREKRILRPLVITEQLLVPTEEKCSRKPSGVRNPDIDLADSGEGLQIYDKLY